ncbi:MAG: SdrD B-like domain-containing protein [Chloroflexota bacterium]|nr:SdrD B-like domain-containing protein [Chloroflexota bacterium]
MLTNKEKPRRSGGTKGARRRTTWAGLAIVLAMLVALLPGTLPAIATTTPTFDGFVDPQYLTFGTTVSFAGVGTGANLYVIDDADDGNIWLTWEIDRSFVDNSYDDDGVNGQSQHPSWAPGYQHRFRDLAESDLQQMQFYNSCGELAVHVTMDYIDGYGGLEACGGLKPVPVIGGKLDINGGGIGDGTTDPADNGSYFGIEILNGCLDLDGDGTSCPDTNTGASNVFGGTDDHAAAGAGFFGLAPTSWQIIDGILQTADTTYSGINLIAVTGGYAVDMNLDSSITAADNGSLSGITVTAGVLSAPDGPFQPNPAFTVASGLIQEPGPLYPSGCGTIHSNTNSGYDANLYTSESIRWSINGDDWTKFDYTTSLVGNLNLPVPRSAGPTASGYCVYNPAGLLPGGEGDCDNYGLNQGDPGPPPIAPAPNDLLGNQSPYGAESPSWETPPGTDYVPQAAYTAGWEYSLIYEMKIDPSVFVTTNCPAGGISPYLTKPLELHASPNKLGDTYVPVRVVFGAIGNYVWLDENSDGYQDAGEPGIPNVAVVLYDKEGSEIARTYTDSHGGYLFTRDSAGEPLSAGLYYVDVLDGTDTTAYTLPQQDMTQTTPSTLADADFGNQDHGSTSIPSTAFTGYEVIIGGALPMENLTADFGYNYNPDSDVNGGTNLAALGDRVWVDTDGDGAQDPNEIGVSGVEVTLYYDQNQDGVYDEPYSVGGYVPTTTTDANGYYLFDDLPAGAYVVTVTGDTGASHDILGTYTQTGDPDDFGQPATSPDNTTTVAVILGPGDVFLNADFGYQPPADVTGEIGDTIWFDADIDGNGPALPPANDPGGAPVNQGNGVEDDSNEYGIPGVTVALIKDSNGNGEWDAGEPIVATDTTDAKGQYLFQGLPVTIGTDDYLVWVNDTDNVLGWFKPTYDADGPLLPAGGLVTGLGISSVLDLTTDTAAFMDQDFGYTPLEHEVDKGLIGDTIFYDADPNDGNAYNPAAGDTPIEGVLVQLWNRQGNKVLATTATDENGLYYFGGLDPDRYQVEVFSGNFLPGGVLEGFANTADPDNDQDNNSGVVDIRNSPYIDLDQDFGYRATDNPGSIGNLIWEDLNADGDVDAGENGIEGVTLDLYRDLNGDGDVDPGEPLIGTTKTDGSGNYLFEGLSTTDNGVGAAGADYIVDVTDVDGVLHGYWHSLGIAGADNNSQLDPYAVSISVASPDNLTADFGYYVKPAAVGNWVWTDIDKNGVQDDGETGINGVVVQLGIAYPDGTAITLVTVTANDPEGSSPGWYSFGNLLLDEDYATSSGTFGAAPNQPAHVVSITVPPGYYKTLINAAGSTFMNDSDNHDGTPAQATQGQNDVTRNADPDAESNPNAGYDFGLTDTPLAVLLADFAAATQANHVLVSWATVSELNNAGFNIYRSLSAGAPETLLNYVPSQAPNSAQGADYSYADLDVADGQTYWYWLEDVDTSGATSLHGPVSVTFMAPTAVTLSDLSANDQPESLNWLLLAAMALAAVVAGFAWRRRIGVQ